MFEELVKQALIGTSRGGVPITTLAGTGAGAADDAVKSLAFESPEDRLLAAAAIASAYETCGAMPLRIAARASPAGADTHRPCSPRAGELLAAVLTMSQTPARQSLLTLWLASAAAARVRPPHHALPELLAVAASQRTLRAAVEAVIDERGRWLAAMNPAWRATATGTGDDETQWQTGNREARVEALRRRRAADPAGARAWLQSSWKQDAAEDRAAFVETLRAGLNADDEAFLESALDDRSKLVRAAAAGALSRLPASAFAKRATDRAGTLLGFHACAKGGFLKKAKPDTITVTLPPDAFDPAWARDGIVEKPEDRTGRRQSWFLQMIRAVPPSHWSTAWQRTPAECVAATSGEYADVLVRAWTDAAHAFQDRAWSAALLHAAIESRAKELPVSLLAHLSHDEQRSLVPRLFESHTFDPSALHEAICVTSAELDPASGGAVIASLNRMAQKENNRYLLGSLLEPLAFLVPATLHDDAAKAFAGDAWDWNRKAVDTFLRTLQMRRDIQREFSR